MAYANSASMQGPLGAQGFDIGNLVSQIVPIILSSLSNTPQPGAGMPAQSYAPQSYAPQSYAPQAASPYGLGTLSAAPAMPGQLDPQSFWDVFKKALPVIVNTVSQLSAAPQMPGFQPQSAGPQFGSLQAQSAGPQGQLDPQSFWDVVSKIVPIAVSTIAALNATPQMPQGGGSFQAQSAMPQFGGLQAQAAGPQGQLQAQSFWDVVSKIVPIAVSTIAALNAMPQVPGAAGVRAQSAGPQYGFGPQSAVTPQGFDIGQLVSQIVPIVLSSLSANPPPNSVIH